MGCPTIQTARLVLRPLAPDDTEVLAALHAEESFWHYPYRRGWTHDETQRFIDRSLELHESGSFALSAVALREGGDLIGWAGLSIPFFLPEVLPAVEVGWRLGEQYRRRGFATEAGEAWVQHGFERHALAEIVSIYDPENTASGAVMRRLGFEVGQETVHPTNGVRLHVMKLARSTWLDAARQARSRLQGSPDPPSTNAGR